MNFKSIKESATEYIRNKIITGEFIAGDSINETALASSLSISRPPIREALRTLENEHLVVSIPRKGTYVRELSLADLRDLYQVREMIDVMPLSFSGITIYEICRRWSLPLRCLLVYPNPREMIRTRS